MESIRTADRTATSHKRFFAAIGILLADLVSGVLASFPLVSLFIISRQMLWEWFGIAMPRAIDDPLDITFTALFFLTLSLLPAITINLTLRKTVAVKNIYLFLLALLLVSTLFILAVLFPGLSNQVLFCIFN